jgi:thiamine-phosphate pyrophosphorylase
MRGLYVIVDPEHCAGRDPRWVAERALAGGCAALQLRAKQLNDAALLTLARQLRALCNAAGVPFWLNDRADLALLSQADGLHLGQHDLPLAEARQLVAALPLGLSTHNLAQARAAIDAGADVIGFGPVFATRSKLHPDPTVGLAELAQVCRALGERPLVAIGGISLDNIAQVAAAGARCAAVISAVCAADDPQSAVRALAQRLS